MNRIIGHGRFSNLNGEAGFDMENRLGDIPLVSVIVLTYQHEDYIARCIEGIIMQETDFPFELLIGTDCSTDRTDEIVRQYHAKYPEIIRPVFRENNLGSRANAEDIHARMRGKYMSTCDGDDEWTDRLKLQKQVAVLEKNPDTVLVFTDIDHFYVKSGKRVTCIQKKLGRKTQYPDPNAWFEAILVRNIGVNSATLCARTDCYLAAHKDIQDILDTSPMADTPTMLALTRYGNFAFLRESTALMNRLPESASRSQSYLRKARFNLGSIKMQLAMARKYGYSSKPFEKMLSRRALMVLRLCMLEKSSDHADEVMRTLSGTVRLNWQHRLFQRLTKNTWASAVYRHLDTVAIEVRRHWRRFRYGIESSV